MLTMRKYPNSDACHLVQDTITHLSLRWPFNGRFMNRPGCVDGVLCVSVLQHLPNKYRQLEAIENLIRVCHPGSRVLLYVWSFEKEGMEPRLGEKTRQDHFVSWKIVDKDGRGADGGPVLLLVRERGAGVPALLLLPHPPRPTRLRREELVCGV